MGKTELIDLLENTKAETLSYYNLSEAELMKCYAEGKWNIRQLLCHLADAETVLYDRIKRVISEPKQVIWAFDQDAWANKLEYNKYPLSISKQVYASVREAVIYLANEHYENLGNKVFVHSETGIRTLKDEFEKIAVHYQGHLKQIVIALKNK